jgi:hypothetical protein
LNYIQIPLNIEYKIPYQKNWNSIIGTGLYGAAGLSGTEKGSDEVISGNITPLDNTVKF